ncbi:hypothetical protein [Flavobacterium daejeonense]|uniref:hypothetical protein n=1 Tax=Flavobacterium daejeonense TaxID=350893 RepID=UPI00047C4653|nr:hypothetical protein [Flavobacterium daejeonense]
MAIDRNSKKPSDNGGFLATVERYWLVLLGLVIGYPIIMRYFQDAGTKDLINKQEEQEKVLASAVQNPVTQLQELNKITTNTYYHNIARDIAVAFGTDVLNKEASIWTWLSNPSSWTENDEKAYLALLPIVNSGQQKVIVQLYYVLTRRDLNYDVKKYLDKKYLDKLPLFK